MTGSTRKAFPASVRSMMISIFVLASVLNYPWERVQSILYLGEQGETVPWWHCLSMSLGDGLLVLLIFFAGLVIFDRPEWFEHPGLRGYALMLTAGLMISVFVEVIMVHLAHRWSYTAQMPLIPGLGVGVAPVAQMLILPPVIFRAVTWWYRRVS